MPSSAHLSIFQFSNSCTFCLAVARMSKGSVLEAFHSQPATPLCLFSLPASCELFFFYKLKCQRSQLSSLGRFALCLNLSCAVFILPYKEPQSAKSSFVDLYAQHLHHIATNFCCLKSCLLVTVVTGTCTERWSVIE